MRNKETVLFIHNTIADYRFPFFEKLLQNHSDVKLIITHPEMSQYIYRTTVFENELINTEYLSKYKIFSKRLINCIKKSEANLIVIPAPDGIQEILDFLFCFITAKKQNKRVCLFWERWEFSKKGKTFKAFLIDLFRIILLKRSFRKLDLALVPGIKSKEYLISLGVPNEKIIEVVDTSNFPEVDKTLSIRKKYNIPEYKSIILYFGRIVRRKGPLILIKAFEKMHNENAVLLICGDGPYLQECKNYSNEHNLNNIIFTGQIDTSLRGYYFSCCDLFVLPSYYYKGENEPWGLSVNEALQAGKPVIATDVVGSAYTLLNDQKCGYIVPQNDEVLLKDKISYLLENNELRINMGECASKRNNSLYTYDHMEKSFWQALMEVK